MGRAVAVLMMAASAAAGAGFWAGTQWQQGQTALAQEPGWHAQVADLREAMGLMQQQTGVAVQDMRAAAVRMDAISLDHWRHLDALDSLYTEQRTALDRQMASVAAVQLRDCRIGDFGVQLWAAAAAGADFDTDGASGPGAQPSAPTVPGRAADAGLRYRRGSDAGMAEGSQDVSPLPAGEGSAGIGGGQL